MDLEAIVADARARRPQPMPTRERLYAGASALGFIGSVAALGAALPSVPPPDVGILLLLVALYALASR